MISSTRQTIGCILMVAGIAVCGHAQSASSKQPTASISGKVTVTGGQAVQGVVIALRSTEPTSFRQFTRYRGVTDAKGEYRIGNVPPGKYTVVPSGSIFLVAGDLNDERTVIVNEGETINDFDFSLIRGGVITGKVVDSDGRPVIEEEVQLFSSRGVAVGPWPPVITDDRGVYRIFGLRPGSYTVAAGRDGMGGSTASRGRPAMYVRTYYPGVPDAAQATMIQVSDGSEATDVDIRLSRPLTTHTASGRIVNGETGQPLKNIAYGFTRFITPAQRTSISRGDVTNIRGEFKLENLVPGQYAVQLMPDANVDMRAEEVRFDIADHDVTDLVIRTVKGASLSGAAVLEDATDKAIAEQFRGAKLVVFVATEDSRRSGISGVQTALSPDGSFRFGGLPAGKATFRFSGSQRFRLIRVERNGVIVPDGIEVKQGEDITALRLLYGYADGSIRGIVLVENGTIPSNGRIALRIRKPDDNSPNSAGAYFGAELDTRGQFVVENLFPGTYEITAGLFVPGSRQRILSKPQEVVVTAGSTANTVVKLDLSAPQTKP